MFSFIRIFTLSFRSFSPLPNTLEFHPGQDYYFISTSSARDLHRRAGGSCSTHNMKVGILIINTLLLSKLDEVI